MNTVIVSTGRFNPPTVGHSLLFKRMLQAKSHFKADRALLYATHSQDPKRNPLSYEDKIGFLKALVAEKYKGIEVVSSQARNIIETLIELDGSTDNIILIIGQDRLSEFEGLLKKYNGKEYKYKSIKVISAGDRDPDSDTISGMSASKIRQAVREDDFRGFRRGIDSFDDKLIQDIWNALRKGMNITEYIRNVRDAYTLKALKEYCQLREAGELPEEEPETPTSTKADEFLKRVSTLYSKAGLSLEGGTPVPEGSAEEPEDRTKLKGSFSKKAEKLLAQIPKKELTEFSGEIGVLLIDEIVGTKFLSEYIGRFYGILEKAIPNNFGGLRVAIRQLRSQDDATYKASLLGAHVAWTTQVGNPNFIKKVKEMDITFGLHDTDELLRNCSASKLHIDSISNVLTDEKLDEYITDFVKKNGMEDKFDYTSLNRAKQKTSLTQLGNEVRTKETEADQKINEFEVQIKSKTFQKEDLQKFIVDYGVDKRILATRLTLRKAHNSVEADPNASHQFEDSFKEISDVLGIAPLLMIADVAANKGEATADRKRDNKDVDAEAKASAKLQKSVDKEQKSLEKDATPQ